MADRELPRIGCLSAITLATHDMTAAVDYYTARGFESTHGGAAAPFTTLRGGAAHLNLVLQPRERAWTWWGRVIFHVSDVDAMYERVLALGLTPDTQPADAAWGERYFHLTDPDGHQLSFAKSID